MNTFRKSQLLFLLILLCMPINTQAADCTGVDAWDVNISYSRGDLVTYAGSLWRAKRNTTGRTPGTHKPTWADQGSCDGDTGGGDGGGGEQPEPTEPTPIQIFGLWHAGNHYADWSLPRDTKEGGEFDQANGWIVRGNEDKPAVNLVVLSFLQPMDVLLYTTEENPKLGVPLGMTRDVVEYFASRGISVMMSIGGLTYIDYWNQALAINASLLGHNAALIAQYFNVGIEIDYEENTDPDLAGLEKFVTAYRAVHPFDPNDPSMPHRLTIDLAAGGRYLQDLNRYATINWLDNSAPVLDWANAMVHRSSGTPDNWQEHVDGMPTYNPVIPPKAPNRFTGGLYLKGNMANCTDFAESEQARHADYVQTVAANGAGQSPGMLGYMFWAAEKPSARKNYKPTTPEGNTCEGGMGAAAAAFDIPIPMQRLRQN